MADAAAGENARRAQRPARDDDEIRDDFEASHVGAVGGGLLDLHALRARTFEVDLQRFRVGINRAAVLRDVGQIHARR